VNLSSTTFAPLNNRFTARWLAPDESGDRPYLRFVVQARPQNAEGAAWVDVIKVARQAQLAYVANGTLPARSAGIPGWDVRVCALTELASSCTPALTPGSALLSQSAALETGNSFAAAKSAQAQQSFSQRSAVASARAVAPAAISAAAVKPNAVVLSQRAATSSLRQGATAINTGAAQSVVSSGQIAPASPASVTSSVLYAVGADGDVRWYRSSDGKTLEGPRIVANGWSGFSRVFGDSAGTIYTITPDGSLNWYHHGGFADGGGPADAGEWSGPKPAGQGWESFTKVFPGGEGVIYAIARDGTLVWYRHRGSQDGSAAWEGPKTVGNGWGNFVHVFGGGDGVIYAIARDGALVWYRHGGFQNGSLQWEGPRTVGSGWAAFKDVFSAGNGRIFAVAADGSLLAYTHKGFKTGVGANVAGAWEGPQMLGGGWQAFANVFTLLPVTPAAVR
jgi:hypothetical protein